MAIEEQMEFIFWKGRTIERRTGVMRAEYRKGCPQRDGVENEGYVGARSVGTLESKERDGAKNLQESLQERILDRDNLNRTYKQIKRNHGAPGRSL
ncbi:hypothetical protein [Paenibacillus polymyxa]|uniref:hypothetical protein n=1 Tax=Paenibacillus polymyxa TaxID=1406 RepID=UPI000AE7B982|nr:hypothetical protein [Paenibacillus polymyxa]MBY7740260.1 hypothetical protein [Paenibacillus polymyxa]MEE4581021.1 hypothetical protein [Paenibacillus polymyxa]